MRGREAAGKNSLPEQCPQAGGLGEAGVETGGMRTPAGRGSECRSCLSAHRAVPRGTRSEGEEEGAGEVCQIGGARGSFSFTSDRTPMKSSKPPRCCAASPVPLPSLSMLSSGLKTQPHTRCVKCSLSTSCMALAGCSRSPQPCEIWAGPFPQSLDAGQKWRAG